MADKVTSTRELKLVMQFTDGDTRTLTLPDPKNTLDAEKINAAAAVLEAKQVLVGDKTGAPFIDFGTKALVQENERIVLDSATL